MQQQGMLPGLRDSLGMAGWARGAGGGCAPATQLADPQLGVTALPAGFLPLLDMKVTARSTESAKSCEQKT